MSHSLTDEMLIDDLPAPGEPLTPAIAPENKAALDAELQARLARLSGKLNRRQLWWARLQYKRYHRLLRRAGYNKLIQRRWQIWQEYQALKRIVSSIDDPIAREPFLRTQAQLGAQGRKLNAQIQRLSRWAGEFDRVAQALASHEAALAWELEDKQNTQAFKREARTWEAQIKAVFRQSARLHHKFIDSRGRERIRIPEIQQVVFKPDRVLFQIKTMKQSIIQRLFGRWTSGLPYNVDVTALASDETLENLSAACNRVVTVERSKKGTNFFYAISRPDAPDGIPSKVLYSTCAKYYPYDLHDKTPWAAGISSDRKVIWKNFQDEPHVLIAGSTQSGKSNHVNQMIATLTTVNTPDELRLLLIDLKGGVEFTHWSALKHQIRPMIRKDTEILGALKWVNELKSARLANFERVKAKNLSDYNARMAHRLPRIIVFVDELSTILGLAEKEEIHQQFREISAQGRAVGVHLVLCTQHSSVNIIPGDIKTNLTLRISGRMPSIYSSQVILDSITAASLPSHPGRLVFSTGRDEIICQSPYISDDEIARAVAISQEYPDPNNDEFNGVQIVAREKFGRDDFIQVALSQMGGKLTATRTHEYIGNNDLLPLRKARSLLEDILNEAEDNNWKLEFRGATYDVKKTDGKRSYMLVRASEQTSEHESAA